MTCSYIPQSVTDSTVAIDKNGVVIPVSLDLVTKMIRVPDHEKFTARLHNTASHLEPSLQKNLDKNSSPFPSRVTRSSHSTPLTKLPDTVVQENVWSTKSDGMGTAQNTTLTSPHQRHLYYTDVWSGVGSVLLEYSTHWRSNDITTDAR